MPSSTFRDAASIHVNAPPERVRDLISRPSVLQALDERLQGRDLEITTLDDRVEVREEDGDLQMAFRVHDEDEGSRVAALETLQTRDPLEVTKHMLMPGKAHREFEAEMDRLRLLVEGLEVAEGS